MSLYLPLRYESVATALRGIRRFAGRELESSDRIARHIERGSIALLEGRWEQILTLWRRLEGRLTMEARQRLMLQACGDQVHGVEPPVEAACLAQLLGERESNPAGGYLVALPDLLAILNAGNLLHPVDALGGSLIVHQNVLVPRSQPLIHLLRRAMEAVRDHLPHSPDVLDMGCGSGCCALLAARLYPGARVTATDLLPEAVATTRINADRFTAAGMIRPSAITVAEPGNLFDRLGEAWFDLIIFNAPWVIAPARNRMETALNDAGQLTARRFLADAAARLAPGGRIILGYADHSGPRWIDGLEAEMTRLGLRICRRHTDRIKTHRKRRAWEAIYAYELTLDACGVHQAVPAVQTRAVSGQGGEPADGVSGDQRGAGGDRESQHVQLHCAGMQGGTAQWDQVRRNPHSNRHGGGSARPGRRRPADARGGLRRRLPAGGDEYHD